MQNVRIDKNTLTDILRKNRDEHEQIFLDAQKNYREAVIKRLDEMLETAKTGKRIETYVNLIAPANMTEEYDTVLHMFELSEDETIVLTQKEFKQFVEDEWSWSQQFATSNVRYMGNVGIGTSSPSSTLFNKKYSKYLNNDE